MFLGCSSLAEGPELPATTLVDGCYVGMFYKCTSLTKVKVAFTSWHESATDFWFFNASPTGTFVCPEGLPVDGLQAEGPNARFAGYSYKDTAYPRCTERFAILNEFADVHFAIAMDEPIVNNMANTMMVFGLLVK
jgi:hypothetical protein